MNRGNSEGEGVHGRIMGDSLTPKRLRVLLFNKGEEESDSRRGDGGKI